MARKKVDSKKKKAEKQAKQAPQADKEPKVNACDASYRQYFSFREVMEDFLRYYVPEKLRGIVHYDSLRRYDSQNITRNWTDSREDLIWCAQTLKTVERDIYFPVEFQSAESKEMLFRLLQYVAILYRALLDEGVLKTSGGSTLILPIVIYNGDKPWSAARSMNEIHDPIEEDLKGGFQVHFKYFVVDIGRLNLNYLSRTAFQQGCSDLNG